MPRFILVPATGADSDASVFATALAVARVWAGHLKFLHVHADVDAILMTIAGTGIMATTEIAAHLEQDIAERHQRAERMVRDFCAREEVLFDDMPGSNRASAEWRVETGDEEAWLATQGRVADLIVVGRACDAGVATMDLLEAALLQTGRPMVIAAAKPPRIEAGTIAIAWKDTREAARAVAASLPFVAKAARVIIFSVEEDTTGHELSGNRLAQALRWHNPEVTLQGLVPDNRAPVDTLLDAAGSFQANLLVMGAYSHSRTREVMFGGFTRRVLRGADLPVLMAR
ncbi:MAG: universal stress protein [Acetobacteraceae bacterium]